MDLSDPEAVKLLNEYPILRYFEAGHLPEPLRITSEKIGELARYMALTLPGGAETAAGLRKLIEAKDCFVRAALSK